MISRIDKNSIRQKRHQRTRRHILGTAERPRLNVYRSLNHIYAQVIDDDASHTLAAASTLDAEVAAQLEGKTKSEAAEIVGEMVGIKDIRTKSYGSNNPANCVKATLDGLSQLRTAEEIARLRGKTVEEILG